MRRINSLTTLHLRSSSLGLRPILLREYFQVKSSPRTRIQTTLWGWPLRLPNSVRRPDPNSKLDMVYRWVLPSIIRHFCPLLRQIICAAVYRSISEPRAISGRAIRRQILIFRPKVQPHQLPPSRQSNRQVGRLIPLSESDCAKRLRLASRGQVPLQQVSPHLPTSMGSYQSYEWSEGSNAPLMTPKVILCIRVRRKQSNSACETPLSITIYVSFCILLSKWEKRILIFAAFNLSLSFEQRYYFASYLLRLSLAIDKYYSATRVFWSKSANTRTWEHKT